MDISSLCCGLTSFRYYQQFSKIPILVTKYRERITHVVLPILLLFIDKNEFNPQMGARIISFRVCVFIYTHSSEHTFTPFIRGQTPLLSTILDNIIKYMFYNKSSYLGIAIVLMVFPDMGLYLLFL